ncbi:cytoplasmic protein [bacterium]|nr:cytoplasmic protein [bacterium]
MSKSMKEIYKLSVRHEKAVLMSEKCGCFYCVKVFLSSEIDDWIDERKVGSGPAEKTAICPRCGIDSVLPQSDSFEISDELLKSMREQYFARM